MTSYTYLIFIVVILAFFYFVMMRPQQKQRREFQAMISRLKKGDQILTSSGIYGTIKRIDDDILLVEIAKGTSIKIPRRAVAEIITDPEKARALRSESASSGRRGKAAKELTPPVEEEEVTENETETENATTEDQSEVVDEADTDTEETDDDEDPDRPNRRRGRR